MNGQRLWVSLFQLYGKLQEKSDAEACQIIIAWCQKHTHPYYFYGDPYNIFDAQQRTDADFWDFYVNCLEMFEFTLERFKEDLQKLYTTTQIMVVFHNLTHDLEIDRETVRLAEKALGHKGFFHKYRPNQLLEIKQYVSKHIPKFPLELTLNPEGDFIIAPVFQSVFDVAYYAMAQYVSTAPDYPIHWGGRTGIAYCQGCGKIFIKNGNRQKYCDDPECKRERDRRKSKDYYYRKIQREKDEEWA